MTSSLALAGKGDLLQRQFIDNLTQRFNTGLLEQAVAEGCAHVLIATPGIRKLYLEWQEQQEDGAGSKDDARLVRLSRGDAGMGPSSIEVLACRTRALAEEFQRSVAEPHRAAFGIARLHATPAAGNKPAQGKDRP